MHPDPASGASASARCDRAVLYYVLNAWAVVDPPTDKTDGGAFLYLFSRFRFVVGLLLLGCVAVVAGDIVLEVVSLPPSASLPSELDDVLAPINSRDNVMSYWIL